MVVVAVLVVMVVGIYTRVGVVNAGVVIDVVVVWMMTFGR